MRRPVVTVLVALAIGVAFGLVVARSGSVLDGTELTDVRLWLLGATVLAAFATGPVTGALVGLAAMAGALGALELVTIRADQPPTVQAAGVSDAGWEEAVRLILGDTSWLDPALLAGGAVAGAAIGTIRLVLRTGRRLALLALAIGVLAIAVLGAPELSDLPIDGDVGVIR